MSTMVESTCWSSKLTIRIGKTVNWKRKFKWLWISNCRFTENLEHYQLQDLQNMTQKEKLTSEHQFSRGKYLIHTRGQRKVVQLLQADRKDKLTTAAKENTSKNRKPRLQVGLAHQNWTLENSKNVAWSDKSPFLLQISVSNVRIWCKHYESMDPCCLTLMLQIAGGGVMVWETFSWHTSVPLGPTEQCLNTTVHLCTFSDHVPLWHSVNISWWLLPAA